MVRYKADYKINTVDSDGPSMVSFYLEASSDQMALQIANTMVKDEVKRVNDGGGLAYGGVSRVWKVTETLEEIANYSPLKHK